MRDIADRSSFAAAPEAAARTGPVVLLMSGSQLGACVANDLARRFPDLVIIAEPPETKATIIRRRARLLGWLPTLGQVACGVLLRMAEGLAEPRRRHIVERLGVASQIDPSLTVHRVPSVNSQACHDLLRELAPSVVAVYGTRILRPATLAATGAPFINYHAGINPKYRGQHPAYWALVADDAPNAGVTIHLVDKGVDTGDVLYQAPVTFAPADTILTYQWVQLETALPLLNRAIEDARHGCLAPRRVSLPSKQYFPPTLWSYLWNGLTKRVW